MRQSIGGRANRRRLRGDGCIRLPPGISRAIAIGVESIIPCARSVGIAGDSVERVIAIRFAATADLIGDAGDMAGSVVAVGKVPDGVGADGDSTDPIIQVIRQRCADTIAKGYRVDGAKGQITGVANDR